MSILWIILIFIITFLTVVFMLRKRIGKGELSLGKHIFFRFEANSQETRILKEKIEKEKIEKESVSTVAVLTTLEKEFDIMKPWNLSEDLKIIKKMSREERDAAFRLGLYASGKKFNNAGNVKISDNSYSWDEN